MATSAAILDTKLSDSVAEDSYSILGDLLGLAKRPARPAIVYASINGFFAIQQGKWKLEFCPGSGGRAASHNDKAFQQGVPLVQLYEMQSDAGEKVNLEAAHPEVVKRLRAVMEQYVTEGRSTPGKARPNDVQVDLWKKGFMKQVPKGA